MTLDVETNFHTQNEVEYVSDKNEDGNFSKLGECRSWNLELVWLELQTSVTCVNIWYSTWDDIVNNKTCHQKPCKRNHFDDIRTLLKAEVKQMEKHKTHGCVTQNLWNSLYIVVSDGDILWLEHLLINSQIVSGRLESVAASLRKDISYDVILTIFLLQEVSLN